jgi:hypothetical protein
MNRDHPIRNTLTHLALGTALGITLLAPASATPVTNGSPYGWMRAMQPP